MKFIQNKIFLSPDSGNRNSSNRKPANQKNNRGQSNQNQKRPQPQNQRQQQNIQKPSEPQNQQQRVYKYREPEIKIPAVKEPDTWYGMILFRIRKWYDGLVINRRFKVEVNRAVVIKSLVYGLYLVFVAALQTTVFTRFNFFGSVPDLMLTSVIVISMFEGERWGAAAGIFAGYIIDAVGSTGLSLMPLVYMLFGYICGVLTINFLTNSLPVWGLYMIAAAIGRGIVSLIYILALYTYYPLNEAFAEIIIPEMVSTLVFSILTYGAVRLISKPFRKRRRDSIEVI